MPFATSELKHAFERSEFFPAFQPVVELRTGKLTGFEVLARWMHPREGLVPPDAFIPSVERHGFIDRLTELMLQKAFACSVSAQANCSIAVNISPIQLADPKLPEFLARTAERVGLDFKRVVIEITESALLEDLRTPVMVATELKSLGCKLALDDFGTGYSTLRHLHALPLDALKVDRSFVSSMVAERGSRKIVASVIGLGQSLGLMTVAEGIETPEQAEMLFSMGCDLGQGWLYGKPVHVDQLPRILAEASANYSAISISPLTVGALGPDGPPMHRLAQLQAIYDGAPVGLALLDRNLRYVSLNRQLANFNDRPAHSHLGKTPAEIVPHVFRQVETAMRSALAGEARTGVEIQKKLANGESQVLLGSYEPVRDEAGEVIGVSVAVMDITERKRMEEILHEVEDHYRNMVDLSPHVPWVLNPHGEVIDASARWESITGQPVSEAMGNGWMTALHPDDIPATEQAVRLAIETGQQIDINFRVRQPGGGWKWMRSRGVCRYSAAGELIGIYGVVEEATELPQPVPVRKKK